MSKLALFRRRQVWLPTFIGWMLLLAIIAMFALAGARIAYPFLAQNSPAPNASLLVVEGWLDAKELDQAMAVFRRGKYKQIVTTGGPLDYWPELLGASTHAELAANYLRDRGLAGAALSSVPAPASAQDRTFLSAVKLRDWMETKGLRPTAVDIVSSGAHARRTGMLYRMALGPEVDVGILAVRPDAYVPEVWWQSSAGAKAILGEAIGIAWTACCFFAPTPHSAKEAWGTPEQTRIR